MTLSSNIFNNVADISENILDVLHNNAKTPSRVNRDYDSPFHNHRNGWHPNSNGLLNRHSDNRSEA